MYIDAKLIRELNESGFRCNSSHPLHKDWDASNIQVEADSGNELDNKLPAPDIKLSGSGRPTEGANQANSLIP